jgi:N-acetylmuramic acid 6-phosphate etherase
VTIPVDVAICPVVGPEAIMGSTRMKAGTAQKLVLNMISTATMVRLGKIYENMMVDLMATSQKLVERGRRTLMTVTGLDYEAACARLDEAGGSVKVAIVMTLAGAGEAEARARLERAHGFVRAALEVPPGGPA